MKRKMLAAFCIMALVAWGLSAAPEYGELCKACGEPITGPYFETGGAFYHPEHFTCAHCGEPILESYTVYKGNNYHRSCFENHMALRCNVCNGIIQGQYLLDYWGNAYHVHHQQHVTACDFCNRLIAGNVAEKMRRFDDGRTLCGVCSPTSIVALHEAWTVLNGVAASLKRVGLDVNTRDIELRLVSQGELRKLSPGRGHNTTGFTDYVVRKNLFGRRQYHRVRVYLLRGMPRTQMIGTIAHELTHVWQFIHGRLDQDLAVSEGSCNYASYLVLRRMDGSEAEYIIDTMLRDEHPVYGDGFRRIKHYAEENGIASWLRLLKEKNPNLAGLPAR